MVGDGFGEGEGEEVEGWEGDDLGLGERAGFSEGDGVAFCNGFTGPVGRRGGAGLAVGVGEGAAVTIAAPREESSAKINERNLMAAAARPP